MEDFACQRVTGFINNSNLQTLASADDLRAGYPIIMEASRSSGIPVICTCGREEFLNEFLEDEGLDAKYLGRAVPLVEYMKRSWDTLQI